MHDGVAAGDKLYTRKTSCFCEHCFSSDGYPPAMDGLNRLWKVTHLNWIVLLFMLVCYHRNMLRKWNLLI